MSAHERYMAAFAESTAAHAGHGWAETACAVPGCTWVHYGPPLGSPWLCERHRATDEPDDGLVLIAGVLYDRETGEEADDAQD